MNIKIKVIGIDGDTIETVDTVDSELINVLSSINRFAFVDIICADSTIIAASQNVQDILAKLLVSELIKVLSTIANNAFVDIICADSTIIAASQNVQDILAKLLVKK